MSESVPRRSVTKRIVFVLAGFLAFALVWLVAVRLAVMNIFQSIETQKAGGLSAVVPFSSYSVDSDKSTTWGRVWISRSASLQLHTDSFDQSVEKLHGVVATHQGYLEDLRTESRTGSGRTLFATVSVPSADFDAALADLKASGSGTDESRTPPETAA